MRKTLQQIVEEQKKQDNSLVMNSDQRLERARLLNAAEFGAACLEHWPALLSALRIYCDERGDREDTAMLNKLTELYEVTK